MAPETSTICAVSITNNATWSGRLSMHSANSPCRPATTLQSSAPPPARSVNAITKSGTNQWHGSAYDFVRNSDADAKSYFATAITPKALLVRNQYGGSFGGPILRDRLFFFAAYEGIHDRADTYNQGQVPSLLERAGDFSQSNTPIYDPDTTAGSGAVYTRTPFANNVLPVTRLNATGQQLVDLYPLPNLLTGGTYYYASNIPSILDGKKRYRPR